MFYRFTSFLRRQESHQAKPKPFSIVVNFNIFAIHLFKVPLIERVSVCNSKQTGEGLFVPHGCPAGVPTAVTKNHKMNPFFKVPLTPLGEGDLGGEGNSATPTVVAKFQHFAEQKASCFIPPLPWERG